MGNDTLLKRRVEFSEVLLKEAQSIMTGQPRVWARQFGEQVTFGETMGKMARSYVPFAKSSLRQDVLVFHDIPTQAGILHVVQFYSGQAILPADFLMTLPFNLPYPAWAKEDFIGSHWTTELAEIKQPDPLKDFLDGVKRGSGWNEKALIDYGLQWTWSAGKTSVKLPYTLQLFPNGAGQMVAQLRKPFKPGMFSMKDMKFGVANFMELIGWLCEALPRFSYPASPAPIRIPCPAESLLAIPELAALVPDKGSEIPWPALPQYAVAAAPTAQAAGIPTPPAAPIPTPPTEAEKFCSYCGKKIKTDALYCAYCGAKQ